MKTLEINTGIGTVVLTYSESFKKWDFFSGNQEAMKHLEQAAEDMGWVYDPKKRNFITNFIAENAEKFVSKSEEKEPSELWGNEKHTELRSMVKNSFSKFNNKIEEFKDKLIINIEQCSVVLEWLPELKMYQIFINEPDELKINSNYKKIIQEKIDNIIRAWNPFQEYEENGIEINHKYWIDNLS